MERLTQKLPQGGYEAKVDPFSVLERRESVSAGKMRSPAVFPALPGSRQTGYNNDKCTNHLPAVPALPPDSGTFQRRTP